MLENIEKITSEEIYIEVSESIKKYCILNNIDYGSDSYFRELLIEEIKLSMPRFDKKEDFVNFLKRKIINYLKTDDKLSDKLIQEYIRDIRNLDIISKNEEMDILKDAKNNIESKNKVIEAYLKFVIYIARKYVHFGLSLEDLIQEGNIGLIKAIEKFNPSLGYQFSTYAYWWIKHCIVRAIQDNGKTIRIPVYADEKIRLMKKQIAMFERKNNRRPTDEELSIILNMSIDEIAFYKKIEKTPISLNALINDETDEKLEDFIPNNEESVEDIVIKKDLCENIDKLFNAGILKEREIEILKLRYGFYDDNILTLEEISKKYGMTRERVRQIERNTLIKIKKSYIIKDYFAYSENKSYKKI